MKIVLISDTHTFHDTVTIPECDVLVHAGDLTFNGHIYEVQEALDWLMKQPAKEVVFTAGNHDFAFERAYAKEKLDLCRLRYLQDEAIEIDGKKFYGSPWQPAFCGWAFNVERGQAIKKYWDLIPEGIDVLITHGPPMGLLDQSSRGRENLGCEELAKRIDIVKPKVHVFGHIHGGRGHRNYRGMDFYNASVVNEAYNVVHEPYVITI